ncbi:MAG: enoyl-CoA hydratase, partial [Mycobacterium sp.]
MATPDQATSAVNGDSADLVAYETLDEGRIARIWLN